MKLAKTYVFALTASAGAWHICQGPLGPFRMDYHTRSLCGITGFRTASLLAVSEGVCRRCQRQYEKMEAPDG